jgi:hypothetical protein
VRQSASLHTQKGGCSAHLKTVLARPFVKHERLIEFDSPASVLLGLGLERLIAQRDPSTSA